jgi:hypothetical protein
MLDEQGLVGDRVEIGAKLGVPAEALGKIAIGRIGEARKQEQYEGRRHLMGDDQPHDERHQDDARQRQRVGDIHEGSNSRVAAHQTPTEAIEVLRFSRFVTAWPHPRL